MIDANIPATTVAETKLIPKAAAKVNEAHELVDFTPVVEETKEADAATETPVEAAE